MTLAAAPASRVSFCGSCRRATRQRLAASTNGRHPRADHYLCGSCGAEVLSLADVRDALGLCATVAAHARGQVTDYGDVKSGEREELVAHLRLELWGAWIAWDPARAPTFAAYATIRLRQATINWDRERRGRVDQGRSPKMLAVATSLDEPLPPEGGGKLQPGDDGGTDGTRVDRVRASVGEVALDDRAHSLTDLRRTLSRRRRELAREDAVVGREAPARAPA